MKLVKGTKFRTRSGNEYMIAETSTGGVYLDFHNFFYQWDIALGYVECGDWVITTQPVFCGCKKHEIDPEQPVHDQHRKWMLRLGGIEDIKEGIAGEVVEYRTAFSAQTDEMWGEEFEK